MSDTMRDSDLNELAKIYAASYASPHHITFTLDGLKNLIAQAAQSQPAPHGVSNIEIVVDPSIQKGEAVLRLDGKEVGRITNIAAPPPPVPASVQEITRLIQPYVAACLKFNYTPMELIEQAEADVNEAFKPIEAAITALVEKNHELQFSLDGVNAMRRQEEDAKGWTQDDRREFHAIGKSINRAACELPDGGRVRIDLERSAGTVYWLDVAYGAWRHIESGDLFSEQINEAIEATHGIEPEQGDSHGHD